LCHERLVWKPSLNCCFGKVEQRKLSAPLVWREPMGNPTRDKPNKRIKRVAVAVLNGSTGYVIRQLQTRLRRAG
jgi:hypothetical protein